MLTSRTSINQRRRTNPLVKRPTINGEKLFYHRRSNQMEDGWLWGRRRRCLLSITVEDPPPPPTQNNQWMTGRDGSDKGQLARQEMAIGKGNINIEVSWRMNACYQGCAPCRIPFRVSVFFRDFDLPFFRIPSSVFSKLFRFSVFRLPYFGTEHEIYTPTKWHLS
jgi:hypothetical protein